MSNDWDKRIESDTSTSKAYDIGKQTGQSNPNATLKPINETTMSYDQYTQAQSGLADGKK